MDKDWDGGDVEITMKPLALSLLLAMAVCLGFVAHDTHLSRLSQERIAGAVDTLAQANRFHVITIKENSLLLITEEF